MTIVHVVEPFASGVAIFVKSLAETMQNDVHIIIHGERSEITPLEDVKKQFRHANVRFIRWRSAQRNINLKKDSAAFFELFAILRRLKRKNLIDAVHLHSSKGGFIGRAACNLLNIKNVIYTPNGAPFLVSNNTFSKFIFRQLERMGNMMGGEVVCCSESEMEAYKKLGINATYVNNGIALDSYNSQESKEKKTTIKKLPGNFRVVTSGRAIDQKDPELFNNIAEYFQEFEQFEFIWIGDGPDSHLLTSKNIQITGWKSHEQVQQTVKSADLYLSTSKFEGLPFAVLEALALKKPVLLTDCVGNRDLVKNSMNGDLFTSADEAIIKILQYYTNDTMLEIMGNHSAAHCRNDFDMRVSYQQYRTRYDRPLLGIV
jgi:glycosyltransferase involved in cell wall biosynthesis